MAKGHKMAMPSFKSFKAFKKSHGVAIACILAAVLLVVFLLRRPEPKRIMITHRITAAAPQQHHVDSNLKLTRLIEEDKLIAEQVQAGQISNVAAREMALHGPVA